MSFVQCELGKKNMCIIYRVLGVFVRSILILYTWALVVASFRF